MNEAIKPYLARSAGAHVLAAAAFVFLVPHAGQKLDKVYMIDFVGGPTTIASAGPSVKEIARAAAAAPSAVAAQTDPDAVAVKGRRHGPIALPRPSLLAGGGKDADRGQSPSANSSLAGPGAPSASEASAAPSAGSGAASASAGAGVSTDMPDFPYPWYISQVRMMLWQAWQKRMPRLDAEGTVGFSILPNGSFTDLSVESSSGDAGFDSAAMAAVQAAAPFPALPSDFHEKFLKIHLALKSEEAWR
ncbi:MAG TPA: TonB family protein [Elusimicrobiota bacterium]|nr:TonB family protein [Elusimicrobiota bacterium]